VLHKQLVSQQLLYAVHLRGSERHKNTTSYISQAQCALKLVSGQGGLCHGSRWLVVCSMRLSHFDTDVEWRNTMGNCSLHGNWEVAIPGGLSHSFLGLLIAATVVIFAWSHNLVAE